MLTPAWHPCFMPGIVHRCTFYCSEEEHLLTCTEGSTTGCGGGMMQKCGSLVLRTPAPMGRHMLLPGTGGGQDRTWLYNYMAAGVEGPAATAAPQSAQQARNTPGMQGVHG